MATDDAQWPVDAAAAAPAVGVIGVSYRHHDSTAFSVSQSGLYVAVASHNVMCATFACCRRMLGTTIR